MFRPENYRPEDAIEGFEGGPWSTDGYKVPVENKKVEGYETGATAKLGTSPAEYSDLGEFKRDTSSEHLFDRNEVNSILEEFDKHIVNLNGDEAGQDLEKAA